MDQAPDLTNEQINQMDLINQNRPQFPDNPNLEQQPDFQEQAEQAEQGFATFTDEEVAHLREIFDLFDKEKEGFIEVKDLETIMASLQRDPAEVRDFIENIDPNSDGKIPFDEFLNLM